MSLYLYSHRFDPCYSGHAYQVHKQIDKSNQTVTLWFSEQADNWTEIHSIAERLSEQVTNNCSETVKVRPQDVEFIGKDSRGFAYRGKYYYTHQLPIDDGPEIITISTENSTEYSVEGLPSVLLRDIDLDSQIINLSLSGPVNTNSTEDRYLLSCVMNKALKEKGLGDKFRVSSFNILSYPDTPEVRSKYGTVFGILTE